MKGLVCALALSLIGNAPGLAQEAPAGGTPVQGASVQEPTPPGEAPLQDGPVSGGDGPSRPLVIDVYPRRAEENGAGSRAEALSRRMERADSAFRAICVGCARGSAESREAFYPYRVLNTAPPRE